MILAILKLLYLYIYLKLPYIYYIGYSAKIDGKNIKITESEKGFCQIYISNEDTKEIKISYTGSIAMKISMAMSLLSLLLILIYLIKNKIKEK